MTDRSADSPKSSSHQDRAAAADGPGASRTPDQVRRDGNHLRDEASVYLQQHSHNPIDWYPWSDAALGKAKAEDKPIFLSIGYSSCHWCHVMEHEVFEQDDVADFLNRHFVCIKVDREERPDIDAIYMDAVHAITGRGGWPLSVFLTASLQPFFGGTYFPHQAFLEMIQKIDQVYREKRDEIDEQAAKVAQFAVSLPDIVKQAGPAGAATENAIGADLIAAAAAQAPVNFDLKWGGFKAEQKFPVPVRWRFLLHYYRKTGDRQYMNLLRQTLEAMASGGIYDHVGGGFHRYTVDREWIVPHFEKMLYDNAQLASLYLEAGASLERKDFLAVGKDVLDFLIRDMSGEEGAFYSSYDADSGGEEGSYYVWTPDELTIAAGADDGPVLAALLGVDPEGNFEQGKTVLTRRSDTAKVAEQFEREPAAVAGLFVQRRQALRDHRDKREAPGLDRKIVTSWNGLAVSAMCHGYAAIGDRQYLEAAIRATDYLWRVHQRDEGRLYRSSYKGAAAHEGVLADYAFFAGALLDLYQVTGNIAYFSRALLLVDRAREGFAREGGGYYMTSTDAQVPLGRKVSFFDSVIPSGNATLMQAMLQIGALTGEKQYRQDVERTLAAFSDLLPKAGLEMSGWFDVALKLNGPFYEVVIAGDPDEEATQQLTATVLSRLPAHAVVAQIPAGGADAELSALLPPVAGKTAEAGRAQAFVCEYGACRKPTGDPTELGEQLQHGWAE